MIRVLTLIFLYSINFLTLSQEIFEKMNLRKSFIDSMHTQTREYVIIDSLTNYYVNIDYSQLNDAQKDLVVIYNLCDSIYELELFTRNPDLILIRAYETFQRIKYEPAINTIENFKKLHKQIESYISEDNLEELFDLDSPRYNEKITDQIDEVFFQLTHSICMLPRGKILSLFYYIMENKSLLYNEISSPNIDNKIEDRCIKEKELNSAFIIGKWEISAIYDVSINDARQVPEDKIKNLLFSDDRNQITFFTDSSFTLNNGKQGIYLLGINTFKDDRFIQEVLIDGDLYKFERHNNDELIVKINVYFDHRYEYEFRRVK